MPSFDTDTCGTWVDEVSCITIRHTDDVTSAGVVRACTSYGIGMGVPW